MPRSANFVEDVYIAFCYLPPENSAFYQYYDTDICLFQLLEDSVCKYKDCGYVYVTGDLNARTGERGDFISNDYVKHILSDKNFPFQYDNEQELCVRKNSDKFVNNFGRKLLDLCKSSGLRIVNGRHAGDKTGDFTFYCSRGNSVIDYLLTENDKMCSITEFSIGQFKVV